MDPLSIFIGGVSAMTSLAGIWGNYLNQVQQYKLDKARAALEAQERKADYFFQLTEIERRMQELDTAAAAENLERKLELQRESARLRVATGEAGVGGNLTERLLITAEQAAGRDTGTTKYNRDIQIGQALRQAFALRRRARAPQLIGSRPSLGLALVGSGLAIAGGVASAYTAEKKT